MKTKKTYKIISGIPVPERRLHSKWITIARDMNIGDCVDMDTRSEYVMLIAALRRQGFVGVLRTQSTGKFRVWKLKREENP